MKHFLSISLSAVLVCCFGESVEAREWSVKNFGAAGDGKALDTGAIQKAVDACHEAGGGRVTLSAGRFLSGTLVLKNRVELHLDKGAVLLASTRHEDFPTLRPEYRSHKDINGFHSLIYAEKAAEIATRSRRARNRPVDSRTSSSNIAG